MSDEKHSPWRWTDPNVVQNVCLTAANGARVLELSPVSPLRAADARLIAAAPEMLSLLRQCATKIPDEDGAPADKPGCAVCGHDPEWPESHPTHRPDCRLAALLARIDEP